EISSPKGASMVHVSHSCRNSRNSKRNLCNVFGQKGDRRTDSDVREAITKTAETRRQVLLASVIGLLFSWFGQRLVIAGNWEYVFFVGSSDRIDCTSSLYKVWSKHHLTSSAGFVIDSREFRGTKSKPQICALWAFSHATQRSDT